MMQPWTERVTNAAEIAHLLHQAEQALSPFAAPDGSVNFPIQAHIVSARR
jgi:hypothetical protein